MDKRLLNLLRKQTTIQDQIAELFDELNKTTTEITNLIVDKDITTHISQKKEFKKKLVNQGYKVKNDTIQNTNIWILSKHSKTMNIAVKECNKENLWYTFNPGLENAINFVVFLFYNKSGQESFIIIDQVQFRKISNDSSKSSHNRFHVKFLETRNTIIEIQTQLDLTNRINSFSILDNFNSK